MSDSTEIGWTDATFNPWWGCERVSPACARCYADTFAKRLGLSLWQPGGVRKPASDTYWLKAVAWNRKAEAGKGPRGPGMATLVFCASMADVFEDHPALPPLRELLWAAIEETPWLRWQLLTKRPENIARMLPWNPAPANVWLGTSIENARFTFRAQQVQEVAAPVHFLSCEPLLGDLFTARGNRRPLDLTGIEWVIGGGESGPGFRPFEPGWALELCAATTGNGIPFFWKQNGGLTPKAGGKELGGREWCDVPDEAIRMPAQLALV